MRWLRDRRLWIALGLVALVVALRLSPLGGLLSLDALARHRAALDGFVAANLGLAVLAFEAGLVD